ncbi:hypothetical protein B9G53_02100 [Pseudanabaena sp. SR411]|uniref:GAF domain-containing protein n=1 Tax=Pseudanabaena sp. SR411 TaxID=1980935 RepID=UPI000B99A49D|nr:GAF domain-containing protein [Pseudanabaena sp. SR411]OYQ67167.1 hypothetical protein B9G53_02100 [Pseudanabaena sp. SR411]
MATPFCSLVLIVPILQNLNSHQQNEAVAPNQLWGLVIAHHCDRPHHWVDFELELMQQLADQISIALAQAQLRLMLRGRKAE